MGAALLQASCAELGVPARISSGGFGPSGEPAEGPAITVMAEMGIDLTRHRSRTLTPYLCRGADLIVAMTRHHVVGVATIEADAWTRTFPLVDLVARTRHVEPLGVGEPIAAWVLRAHEGRTTASVLALPASTDIQDPIGEPVDAYRQMRDRLVELTSELARALAAGGGHLTTPQTLASEPIRWDGWGG
jgi:protein-tyrosine-phosphatase